MIFHVTNSTIPIAEYQKLPSYVLEIKEHCKEHHEKFNLYCKEHECTCCGICNVENHKDCKEVIVLGNITKNVKTSTMFKNFSWCSLQCSLISNTYDGNFWYSAMGIVIWTNIVNIKKYASDLQTFIAIKQIEKEVEIQDACLQSLVNSDRLNQTKLS
jgi:hypothetical protein